MSNCLSYWFPKIKAAGLPVPETRIVNTDVRLVDVLDGVTPTGWDGFIHDLSDAVKEIGLPCFLRTGQTSAKHGWNDTCYLADLNLLPHHVAQIVEFSEICDFIGLPSRVWAVRKIIPTQPLFHAFRGRMPITREFRFFVRDGVIDWVQPYWPADSIEEPDNPDWAALLADASFMDKDEEIPIRDLAERAGKVVGGYWSVDLLEDVNGDWWLTDMAEGDRSFRYDPANPPKRKRDEYIGDSLIPVEPEDSGTMAG